MTASKPEILFGFRSYRKYRNVLGALEICCSVYIYCRLIIFFFFRHLTPPTKMSIQIILKINSVLTSQIIRCGSVRKINKAILFTEIITVYTENGPNCVTVGSRHVGLLRAKVSGAFALCLSRSSFTHSLYFSLLLNFRA
jgi:hypothetical protein